MKSALQMLRQHSSRVGCHHGSRSELIVSCRHATTTRHRQTLRAIVFMLDSWLFESFYEATGKKRYALLGDRYHSTHQLDLAKMIEAIRINLEDQVRTRSGGRPCTVNITRTIAYSRLGRSAAEDPDERLHMAESLRRSGAVVRQIRTDEELRLQLALATDLVHYAGTDAYDVAIVVADSGSAMATDILPSLERVRELGKQTHIVTSKPIGNVQTQARLSEVARGYNVFRLDRYLEYFMVPVADPVVYGTSGGTKEFLGKLETDLDSEAPMRNVIRFDPESVRHERFVWDVNSIIRNHSDRSIGSSDLKGILRKLWKAQLGLEHMDEPALERRWAETVEVLLQHTDKFTVTWGNDGGDDSNNVRVSREKENGFGSADIPPQFTVSLANDGERESRLHPNEGAESSAESDTQPARAPVSTMRWSFPKSKRSDVFTSTALEAGRTPTSSSDGASGSAGQQHSQSGPRSSHGDSGGGRSRFGEDKDSSNGNKGSTRFKVSPLVRELLKSRNIDDPRLDPYTCDDGTDPEDMERQEAQREAIRKHQMELHEPEGVGWGLYSSGWQDNTLKERVKKSDAMAGAARAEAAAAGATQTQTQTQQSRSGLKERLTQDDKFSPEDFKLYTVLKLREELRKRKQKATGPKAELVARLEDFEDEQYRRHIDVLIMKSNKDMLLSLLNASGHPEDSSDAQMTIWLCRAIKSYYLIGLDSVSADDIARLAFLIGRVKGKLLVRHRLFHLLREQRRFFKVMNIRNVRDYAVVLTKAGHERAGKVVVQGIATNFEEVMLAQAMAANAEPDPDCPTEEDFATYYDDPSEVWSDEDDVFFDDDDMQIDMSPFECTPYDASEDDVDLLDREGPAPKGPHSTAASVGAGAGGGAADSQRWRGDEFERVDRRPGRKSDRSAFLAEEDFGTDEDALKDGMAFDTMRRRGRGDDDDRDDVEEDRFDEEGNLLDEDGNVVLYNKDLKNKFDMDVPNLNATDDFTAEEEESYAKRMSYAGDADTEDDDPAEYARFLSTFEDDILYRTTPDEMRDLMDDIPGQMRADGNADEDMDPLQYAGRAQYRPSKSDLVMQADQMFKTKQKQARARAEAGGGRGAAPAMPTMPSTRKKKGGNPAKRNRPWAKPRHPPT